MKQYTKKFVAAIMAVAGLAIAGSTQAQPVTGTSYLSNMDPGTFNTAPSALYPSWDSATFSDGPNGLEVQASGYGSMYYVIPSGDVQYPLNVNDTVAVLTLTFNSGAEVPPSWVGVQFLFNDNAGATPNLGGYGGSGNPGNPSNWLWNGNQLTITAPIPAAQITAIQTGNDAVYTFNLGIDPANLGSPYDITFNSLVLSPVPEPATVALLGLGAAGLLIFRRRK